MFAAAHAAYRYLVPAPAPPPPSSQESSLWFRLPIELREEIYTYFFSDHVSAPLYISPGSESVLAEPVADNANHTALLRTCRAVHAEALSILHATHNINLLVSDPRVLSRQPSPCPTIPITYLPETLVCPRLFMLQLLTHRLKRVTITVRLTSVSPHTLIVKKLAWLLEMLRRRERRLEHLKLHVLNNLPAYSGCCSVREYSEGSRWDVYPETVLVEASERVGTTGPESFGNKLLGGFAEAWEVKVFNNEARVADRQTAEGLWERLADDLQNVQRVLEEDRSWWSGMGSGDVWDSISERPYHSYW